MRCEREGEAVGRRKKRRKSLTSGEWSIASSSPRHCCIEQRRRRKRYSLLLSSSLLFRTNLNTQHYTRVRTHTLVQPPPNVVYRSKKKKNKCCGTGYRVDTGIGIASIRPSTGQDNLRGGGGGGREQGVVVVVVVLPFSSLLRSWLRCLRSVRVFVDWILPRAKQQRMSKVPAAAAAVEEE